MDNKLEEEIKIYKEQLEKEMITQEEFEIIKEKLIQKYKS